MGVSSALLRASGTLSLLAEAFRRLADFLTDIGPGLMIEAVPAMDSCVDVTSVYASPAMPTRSFLRKERWACARKMDWP